MYQYTIRVGSLTEEQTSADLMRIRTPRSAAKLLFESPVSARLIAFEAARQAPLILGKALRGGYRRPGPASGLRVP